jgi:hypothetical protein
MALQAAAAVFTLADCAAYTHEGGPVGRPTANMVLKLLRKTSVEDDVCLTDGDTLDWRAWMLTHRKRAEIIGPGITRFTWHRFQDVPDPGTRGERCDFIVHRQDGTAVRLHPHATREDPQVYGFPCMWSNPPAPPGQGDVANSHVAPDARPVLLAPCHLAMIPRIDHFPFDVAVDFLETCGVALGNTMYFHSERPEFQWWRLVAALGDRALEIVGEGLVGAGVFNTTACPPNFTVAPFGGCRFVFWRANKTTIQLFPKSKNGKTIIWNP